MEKFVFRKTVLYSSYFNFCIYVSRISFFKLTYICKNWNNLNTKPFFEKQILSSFAVLKNMSNSQVSASITLLNVVFQITSSSTDPDFAYTSIISSTAEHVPIFVVAPLKSATNPAEALQSWLYSSTPHSQQQRYTARDTLVLMNFLWITKKSGNLFQNAIFF